MKYEKEIRAIIQTELKQEKVEEALKKIKKDLGKKAWGVGLWGYGDGCKVCGPKKEYVENVLNEFKKLPDFEVSNDWEYYKISPTKYNHSVFVSFTGEV